MNDIMLYVCALLSDHVLLNMSLVDRTVRTTTLLSLSMPVQKPILGIARRSIASPAVSVKLSTLVSFQRQQLNVG
jgi:hypothetical protein